MRTALIVTLFAILATGCRSTRETVQDTTQDSLSVSEGQCIMKAIEAVTDRWLTASLNTDTKFTVVLNTNGDTVRTDRVQVIEREKNSGETKIVKEYVDRYRWRNINHRYYRTITKRVTQELSLWERMEIGGFYVLLTIFAALLVILKVKKQL